MKRTALRRGVALACLLLAGRAMAAPVAVMDEGRTYETLEAAARGALAEALTRDPEVEHGGALLRCGDAYRATVPVTGEARDFEFVLTLPAGCALAGVYHTHPSDNHSELFSPRDVSVARALRVPSFIAIAGDGLVRVFDPRTERENLRNRGRTTLAQARPGRLVK
jgi:hypothetical protein